ncbi:hypothetical protein PR202_ga31206 [Eleusine coracana subsp. coracana]|uniref:Protein DETOXIFICATION n=1 Tax=Eleusine coracana subsp. coracana TaxID=191504 RepID=A0AAV5DPF4_ELECO|nr:hypothetical protein PR202_ga31206 [Eleusine coracana subsp. coracana]
MDEGGHHPFRVFFRDARDVFRWDELGQEIMEIAVPGALALMADPIASLVDTAFIGHIGTVLGFLSVSRPCLLEFGVLFMTKILLSPNLLQVSRIAIFPLVSVTTSFVAEEDATTNARNKDEVNEEEKYNVSNSEMEELIVSVKVLVAETSVTNSQSSMELDVNCAHKRKHIPSVSTALLLGGALGLLETLLLILSAKPILGYMGVMQDSAMLKPALQYLVLRSLGAPAVLLSLAMQGVFRGLKDTKTPLYATGLRIGSRVFTADRNVLQHIYIGIPFVCLTQPINTLAFVFDGINYGASDFGYAAYSMVLVAIISIISIITLANYSGFIGIWIALSVYMGLRLFAGFWRLGTAQGPWTFLRSEE